MESDASTALQQLSDRLFLEWPWIGLGAALVLALLLFATNKLRSTERVGRWYDPVWLAWLAVPVYLLHIFEEYGAHVTDGQFDLVLMFQKMGIDEMFGGLPLFFFPYINITAMWVFAPIAALCARKNPAVGLSFYGFMAVNALTHIGSTAVLGGDVLANPGNVTGIFLFVPLAIWVYHVCVRGSFMDGRGLAACILGGVLGHMLLFSIYIVNLMLGHLAAALWVPFAVSSPIWVSWLLCKAFRSKTPKLMTGWLHEELPADATKTAGARK